MNDRLALSNPKQSALYRLKLAYLGPCYKKFLMVFDLGILSS
jgi:hypothetical protein